MSHSDGYGGECNTSGCNDSHDCFDMSSSNYWGGTTAEERGEDSKKNKGCFIATAVYGDSMASDVVTLRKFRDNFLINYWIGRKFVSVYYNFSPPFADWLKTKPKLSKIIRHILAKFVKLIK